ncbi:MAG: DUF6036 family nucleotidyltransferase [Verrucomicrobiota bacterium]
MPKVLSIRFDNLFEIDRLRVFSGVRFDTNSERIQLLMEQLGKAVRSPGCVYFTGGVSAVLLGWREMTLDVDLKADPEAVGFFEALPKLKESLNINIELAAPDQFVPALPGWRERSRFIAQHGPISFYHYDFYGQALAKVERGHTRDLLDISNMVKSGEVKTQRLLELFEQVEGQLIRYPAVDALTLKQRVLELVAGSKQL